MATGYIYSEDKPRITFRLQENFTRIQKGWIGYKGTENTTKGQKDKFDGVFIQLCIQFWSHKDNSDAI